MTHTYRPSNLTDPALREETARLQKALNEPQPEHSFQVRHTAPVRTWGGMVVGADGTDWNPGSGAGLYLRNEVNTAWRFLGDTADADPALQVLIAVQTEQLLQLTKIALILSAMSGIVIPDDVPLQTGQLRQLTNIALILSSMGGITLDDNLEITTQ